METSNDHLIEFIVDQKPGDAISSGGNDLEIKRVYAYENGAMVEGGYWPKAHWTDR